MDIRLDSFEVWTMELAGKGYGSYNEIKELSIDKFMNLIHYERYLNEYQRVFRELNKKG